MTPELSMLLQDISTALEREQLGPIDLYAIGGTATGLWVERPVGTNDLDAVRDHLDAAVQTLLSGFGPDSGRHFYIQLVNTGTACLPIGFRRRATAHALSSGLVRLHVVCPLDLIVSKLRRWSPRDRGDIECLCDEHPEVADSLRMLTANDFYEDDIWQDVMSARRGLVLEYLDGARAAL